MQDYLEEMREKEEFENEKYEEEYNRLIDDTYENYKDELNRLLSYIKTEISHRESELGIDLGINERELLELILDEL